MAERLNKVLDEKNPNGMSVYDRMEYYGLVESANKVRSVVEEYDRLLNLWWGLTRDMCTCLGNSSSTVYVALEGWIKKMADTDEQENLLRLATSIEDRLYAIKPHEWNDHFYLPEKPTEDKA